MGTLSPEAKLADKVSAHCGISTNATLRVFYALKDLGYEITEVEGFEPKSQPEPEPEPEPEQEPESDELQEDGSVQDEDVVVRSSPSAA